MQFQTCSFTLIIESCSETLCFLFWFHRVTLWWTSRENKIPLDETEWRRKRKSSLLREEGRERRKERVACFGLLPVQLLALFWMRSPFKRPLYGSLTLTWNSKATSTLGFCCRKRKKKLIFPLTRPTGCVLLLLIGRFSLVRH